MDSVAAARRWADTWLREWPTRNLEALLALYHPEVVYASEPFRPPFRNAAQLRDYLVRAFAEEDELEAWVGTPVMGGDHASIEWWATLIEGGAETTLVGTSTLRFDAAGLVVEQRDTWNQAAGRVAPYEGWGR
ncbi:MAG: nuclear transport factor 2 family protein [Chloroflexota bacterium]